MNSGSFLELGALELLLPNTTNHKQNPNILYYGQLEGYPGFAKYNRMMLGNPKGGNYRLQYMFSGSGPKYRVTIIDETISNKSILAGCYFSAELEKQ